MRISFCPWTICPTCAYAINEFHHCRDMKFILKRVKMTVTNIIHISKFPVQQLNILISGGTGNATFFLSKEATAILHVFWVYAKRFPFSSNSPHSLSKPPRQISLNGLLTPYPLHTLTHIHKQIHIQNHLSHIHFPPFFFSLAIAAHEGKRVYWSGKVSSHFTGQVCAVFLSLNGNCSFHLAALPVGDFWEALLERDRGREGVQESGPWSGLGRRQIRAPHAAPACTYLCCWSSVSLSVFRTLIHTCT